MLAREHVLSLPTPRALVTVASLLCVDADALAASLTCTTRETRGEAIVRSAGP